jgi:serine protease AprX
LFIKDYLSSVGKYVAVDRMMTKIPALVSVFCLLIISMALGSGEHVDDDLHGRYFIVGHNLECMSSIRSDLEAMDIEMGEELRHVPYQQVVLKSREMYGKVSRLQGVKCIIEEGVVDSSLYNSARSVKAVPSDFYSPKTAHDLGYTGEGMTIVVIDSGVDNGNHPTFIDSFVAGADFSTPESPLNPRDGSVDPDDLDGHGTGVASVALGRGDRNGERTNVGIAPEAGLIDLRIRKVGPTFENPMAAALEWCIDNRETDWGNGYTGIDVISISAGLGRPDGPVHSLIKTCVNNGLPVVSAATNSGESFEANADGPNYWSDDSIIVGGTDEMDTVDRSDDEYWPQSTWGPRTDDGDEDPYDELKPDISAPASDILVAEAQDKGSPGPVVGWTVSSGTSFATPHVSGTVALMLQANPDIRPHEGRNPVRTLLHQSAEARGEPFDTTLSEKYNVHYGYGILDSYEAVRAAEDYIDSNKAPVIRSLTVTPSTTTAGSVCTVTADAYDPDSDTLTFEISVDGGVITGSYPEYSYTAPMDPGTYTIRLTASDPDGASAFSEATVDVREGEPNRPPSIRDMYSIPAEIKVGMNARIIVEASDPDGDDIEYEWTASSGTITGSGNEIELKAPDLVGTVTVEVVVRDPFGGEDSESIRIRVIDGPGGSSPFIEELSISPDSIREGTSNLDVLITASVVQMDSPIGEVVADLSSMSMGSIQLLDDGNIPDTEGGDGRFTGKLPPVKDVGKGSYEIDVTATDTAGRSSTSTIMFTVQAPAGQVESGGNDEGIGLGSILMVVVAILIALIIVFGVVRLTKRNPK